MNSKAVLCSMITAIGLLLGACASVGSSDLASDEPATFDRDDLAQIEADIQQGIVRGVAECMAVAGFEYVAFVPSEPAAPRAQFDSAEVIGRDGYGIATFWLERAKARAVNPNLDIVVELTPAELDRYTAALHGNGASGQSGCQEKAANEVFQESSLSTLGLVSDALGEGTARIDASAAVADAVEQWTRCMNAAGFAIAGPGDAEARITNEVELLSMRLNATLDPSAGIAEIRNITESELPEDLRQDLDFLIEEERKVATQDLACYDEHVKPVRRPLIEELEREVLENRRSDLEDAGYLQD